MTFMHKEACASGYGKRNEMAMEDRTRNKGVTYVVADEGNPEHQLSGHTPVTLSAWGKRHARGHRERAGERESHEEEEEGGRGGRRDVNSDGGEREMFGLL